MAVTRRNLVLGAGALALLAACGDDRRSAAQSPATAAGGWTFTDDRGRRIQLARRPTRIVAQVSAAATLWDFGVRPIAVFGPHRLKDGGKDPEAGDIDVNAVKSLGNVWDEFNVEQYIALQPEVLVAGMYVRNELWYVPAKSRDAIEQVAPTIGIQQEGKAGDELIKRYEELAVALGGRADEQARARFRAAEAAFVETVARSKRRVMFCAAAPEAFYVCEPSKFPDQKYLAAKGLDIVKPDNPDTTGYFENLSWENVDKYEADAVFLDARAQSMKPEEVAKKPTWAKLPAVRAGHVYPWRAEMRFSYQGYALLLEELTANLAKLA
ncbi:ABC transporter substrate-binding protein [Thermoactinospora rubra]|uniref:ABC transporter substrate-binding protein n=1 Tax=Thermoactinospora rubra TaxID=1088767 RepID=UPI000A0FC093|nr:ABC transporter substrate-binding protein [Thermoactinospora rubra]